MDKGYRCPTTSVSNYLQEETRNHMAKLFQSKSKVETQQLTEIALLLKIILVVPQNFGSSFSLNTGELRNHMMIFSTFGWS